MKKRIIIILCSLGVAALIIGVILLNKNNILSKKKLQIIDATYQCAEALEQFYEDDEYIYYFPCIQSDAVFVKFENDNKMLVTRALEDDKVTIEELIDAGLKVVKDKK